MQHADRDDRRQGSRTPDEQFSELEELLNDVLDNPNGDPRWVVESDATLMTRLNAVDLNEMTAKDAQELLHRQDSLVSSGFLREEASIKLDADRQSGMHFLLHARKASEKPLFCILGPVTGTLCAGNENTYPGCGMLKVSASRNRKIPDEAWTREYEELSVTAWREVQLGPKYEIDSLGCNVRSPKHGDHFIDLPSKVSLVVYGPKLMPRSKRPRLFPTVQGRPARGLVSNTTSASQEVLQLRAQLERLQQENAQLRRNVPTLSTPPIWMTCW